MSLDRVVQVAVRLAAEADAVDQVIDLGLERMVRDVAGLGQDAGQFHPVGLARKLVRPDAVVEDRSQRAEDPQREPVGHDALGVYRDLAHHAVIELHQGHFETVVFHGMALVAPGVRHRVILARFPLRYRRKRRRLRWVWRPRILRGGEPAQGVDGVAATHQEGADSLGERPCVVPARPPTAGVAEVIGLHIIRTAQGVVGDHGLEHAKQGFQRSTKLTTVITPAAVHGPRAWPQAHPG